MKYEWEPEDVVAGRRVLSSNRSEEWMIAYDATKGSREPRWALVSLIDGMIARKDLSMTGMSVHLNASGSLPATVIFSEK